MTDPTPIPHAPEQRPQGHSPAVAEGLLVNAAGRAGPTGPGAALETDATVDASSSDVTSALPVRSVTDVVQAQLEAYNAHDVEALLACYAPSAAQWEYPDRLLAQGHAALRERMAARFVDMRPQATLLNRIVLGSVVIDHERILNQSSDGASVRELIAIYEVDPADLTAVSASAGPNENGRIRSARFVFGEPRPA